MADVEIARRDLVARLFPEGVPSLICPPITHYGTDGSLDAARIRAHMEVVTRHAPCVLVPGSTGDGWELSPGEVRRLLEIHVGLARELGYSMLVGALHPDPSETRRSIVDNLDLLKALAGTASAERALSSTRVVGFTVCGPSGAELSQDTIRDSLRRILDLGLPMTVYQLPQVTKNEISPAVMGRLIEEYPNLWLIKDTSGSDRLARSGIRRAGVSFVRGAECDFFAWLSDKNGEAERKYDGFLLSSANALAEPLSLMIRMFRAGDKESALDLSARIDSVIRAVFTEAATLPFGNPFANANKALDHIMAWGGANRAPAPGTHDGSRLPIGLLSKAEVALRMGGFFPEQGYMTRVFPA
jgi:dihydrodipicolinate synthase/N-acetylneuraminate lyase